MRRSVNAGLGAGLPERHWGERAIFLTALAIKSISSFSSGYRKRVVLRKKKKRRIRENQEKKTNCKSHSSSSRRGRGGGGKISEKKKTAEEGTERGRKGSEIDETIYHLGVT